MAKSLFPSDMLKSGSGEMTLENIAGKLTYFHEQLHLLHWQTQSYAEHQALGGLYDGIHDLTDSFMAVYMGKYGRNVGASAGSVINYNTSNVNETIAAFEAFLIGLTNEAQPTDTDLLNIRDEMLALVHKTQYLLTLN